MLQRFLRTMILSLAKAGWARRVVTKWGLAKRVVSRFIAGERLEDALNVIRVLNQRGITASIDHLGENTSSPAEAKTAAAEVLHALEAIDEAGVRANVSLKLTQLGLLLDDSLCRENLRRVLACARELNIFIRVDMEDSPLTERTLRTWDWAREQGFDNVGVVIQSYLYRSENDIQHILNSGGRVRLCKGAYDEPSDVAFPKKVDVDANYDQLTTLLLEGAGRAGSPQVSSDGRTPPLPAFATHDEARVQHVLSEMKRLKLPRGAVEFQMLYGIRRELQDSLAAQGYPVRVYVPYGTHWYPYFMRRLAERPANIWFFISNFFRK